MIWDSAPWRKELSAIAINITNSSKKRKPSEKLLINLEKNIMIGFYIIRKLIEAKKLSSSTKALKIKVAKYKSLGKPCTLLNWHRLNELFDFSKPMWQHEKLYNICNQIIHSYVFMPNGNSKTGPIKSIIFCSDYNRNNHVLEIMLKDIVEVVSYVIKDYPSSVKITYDGNIKDYIVTETCKGGKYE
jgi:hypothetical protein